MSRRLSLSGVFAMALAAMLVFVVYNYAKSAQGGSECDQDPNCEVLPPSDSGSYTAPDPITEFCVKTGQELICFGQGDNNSGHELAHCWNVTVAGNHVTWSRNEDSSTCQDPSHFQVWWSPGDTPTPTDTATHTSEPPTQTATSTITPTGTENPTDTPTSTQTGTASATVSLTPDQTPSQTATASLTPPEGPSATPSLTQSPTATETQPPGAPTRTPEPPSKTPDPTRVQPSQAPSASLEPSSTPGVGAPPPPSGGGFPVMPIGLLLLAGLLGLVLFAMAKRSAAN